MNQIILMKVAFLSHNLEILSNLTTSILRQKVYSWTYEKTRIIMKRIVVVHCKEIQYQKNAIFYLIM